MTGYWISFGLLFPIVLFGAAELKIYAKKHSKVIITPEMDKISNQKLGKMVLFLWLCNLFYMSCFINNLVCKFIFGGLIMLIIFMNLTSVFTNSKNRSNFDKWSLLFDFLIGIGFSIYLVYIIPNQELKDIVLPIVAALYGGLLTLAGVAWTIRDTKNEKREEEIKKAKPFFDHAPFFGLFSVGSGMKACYTGGIEKGCPHEFNFFIDNSDHSVIVLSKIYHDNKWYNLLGSVTVLTNRRVLLDFKFNDPSEIYLEVLNTLGNAFYYKIIDSKGPTVNGIETHTTYSLQEVSKGDIKNVLNTSEGENNA